MRLIYLYMEIEKEVISLSELAVGMIDSYISGIEH